MTSVVRRPSDDIPDPPILSVRLSLSKRVGQSDNRTAGHRMSSRSELHDDGTPYGSVRRQILRARHARPQHATRRPGVRRRHHDRRKDHPREVRPDRRTRRRRPASRTRPPMPERLARRRSRRPDGAVHRVQTAPCTPVEGDPVTAPDNSTAARPPSSPVEPRNTVRAYIGTPGNSHGRYRRRFRRPRQNATPPERRPPPYATPPAPSADPERNHTA